jgi:predicted TPR repeat methyltransferase
MTDPLSQARSWFAQGNTHFAAGRLSDAESCYRLALELAPGRPSVMANLGVVLGHQGRWPEAVAMLEPAVAANPTDRDALLALGLAREALGRWQPALDALRDALRHGPLPPESWVALARCEHRLGQPDAALNALEQALATAPRLAMAWGFRGHLQREAGDLDAAAQSYEQALVHGGDEALYRFFLASVRPNGFPPPDHPPAAYVQSLFDDYAADFQHHLVQGLRYQGHRTLVAPLLVPGVRYHHALDLGCGTGLCGQLLASCTDVVDGVDLSGAMVAQARASGAYRRVVQGDLLAFLNDQPQPVDLIVAADVFIYVGALEPALVAARARLHPQGRMAFSVELHSGAGLRLLPSLRYAHSMGAVESAARSAGFRVVLQQQAPLREDQGQPISGLYVHLAPVS